MMTLRLTTYLVMNGNAAEAIRFYEKALGATVIAKQTFGEMPENPEHPVPPEAKDRITHARLQVGGSELMLSDTFPGQPHQVGTQVTVTVTTDSPDKSRQIFDALSEGGRVDMPLQETFFSPAYGNLTDKFGVPFQIMTEIED